MCASRFLLIAALLAAPLSIAQSQSTDEQKPTGDVRQGKSERGKSGANKTDKGTALTPDDVRILEKLHHTNRMEIEAGTLAKTRGLSQQIKDFGDQLVREHTDADVQVRKLVQRKNATLRGRTMGNTSDAREMSDAKAKMDRLKTLRGEEFDREFVSMMVSDHQKAIQMVRDARNTAKDADVVALLDKTLPTLEKHREHAQRINAQTSSQNGNDEKNKPINGNRGNY